MGELLDTGDEPPDECGEAEGDVLGVRRIAPVRSGGTFLALLERSSDEDASVVSLLSAECRLLGRVGGTGCTTIAERGEKGMERERKKTNIC